MQDGNYEGAILPGNSTVGLRDFEIPKPGFGQVLIKTMASTICGSDIRCIYREHVGKGPEAYIQAPSQDMNPADRLWKKDRDCGGLRKGTGSLSIIFPAAASAMTAGRGTIYPVKANTGEPTAGRETGGMAPYILAEEKDLIPLPEPLTYKDGAQVACGFGTVL